MRRIGFVLVLLLAICFVGAGQLSAQKQLRVGIVMQTLTGNYFQIQLGEACKKVASALGAEPMLYGPQSFGDYAQQLSIVEDLITKKVDLIILNPAHSQALIPAVLAAKKAGIPIITVDNPIDSKDVLTFIGTDNVKAAYAGAKYVADKIGGKGKVAILEGEAGQPDAILRAEGAKKAFAEYPNIKLVSSQNAHWTEEGGMTVMENVLQANPDLAGAFCSCDNIEFGAYQAAKNKGVRPVLVGLDGIPEAMDAIKNGTEDASVSQFPGKMAEIGVRLGIAYVKYIKDVKAIVPSPFPAIIDSGYFIVDKKTMKDFKGAFSVLQ